MDENSSLIGASLQSSLTTIDIICKTCSDDIITLSETETESLRDLLSQIDDRVTHLSSKVIEAKDKVKTEEKQSIVPELPPSISQHEENESETNKPQNEKIKDSTKADTEAGLESNASGHSLTNQNAQTMNPSDSIKPETTSPPFSTFPSSQPGADPSSHSKTANKGRTTMPFKNEKPRKKSLLQRNLPTLHGPSQFKRKLKSLQTVHPALQDTPTDPDGGATRRTLSQHAPLVIDRNKNGRDANWNEVARDAFRLIDVNNDGFLQREEVIAAISLIKDSGTMGNGVDEAEMADSMMKEVDADGDGQIDMDEFLEMMSKSALPNGNMLSHNNRMSQLARNVLIAHQKKIENSVIGNDMWMIHPLSNFHAIWDILISIIIFLTVVTMPLALGWEELNDAFYPMTLTIDILFLIDVGKNFCTGFVDENDAIIMDAKTVRWNYLTGFFATDFCSVIPFDLILDLMGVSDADTVSGTKNSLKMLKLVRMTKLFRLLRISRLFKQVKKIFLKIEEVFHFHISDGFMKLLRLGLGAVVLGHWIGCFNFMLVRLNDFPEDSWVVYAGLDDKGPYTQWSWSFFKALAQMIMIGFETPPFTNASCDTASTWCSIEHWITLACLYIGAVFYSLLISSISSILLRANLASRQFEEKLVQIDDYMRSKKLPASLREKVKDHFHMQHSDGKLFHEDEIFNSVTPLLRREIKHFNGRDVAMKVPILSSVTNKSFSEDMTSIIEPMVAFIDEIIMREQTTGQEMYFINSGVVEIYLANAKRGAYVAIGDGCFFGEVSLLLGIRRIASVKTKTQCVLYKISKDGLLQILRDHPDIEKSLEKVAQSRRRRLAHYLDPIKEPLLPGDEIDSEDCKTDLFGVDAEEVTNEKKTAYENSRRHAKVGRGITYRETIERSRRKSFKHP